VRRGKERIHSNNKATRTQAKEKEMNRSFLVLFPIFLIVALACGGGDTQNRERNRSKTPSSKTMPEKRETITRAENSKEGSDESAEVGGDKNNPPQITSIKIVNVSDSDPRQGFRAVVEAQDPDGDEVSLRYQWKKSGEDIVGATGEVLEWQEDFKKGDNISVEVTPFDGKVEGIWKAEGSFTIPNSPPTIVSEPEGRMEGGKFIYTVKAEDPDGDPIEFTLKNAPKGMAIEPATGVITWEFDEKDVGEYKVEVTASDPDGGKAVQILNLRVPSENP